MRIFLVSALAVLAASGASAQSVIELDGSHRAGSSVAPPSVDDGRANGIRKAAGAPSVGDGRANGVVKPAGAPSVGDGVANGVVKSTTANQ
ncbi:hypothetical protein P7D22_06120 [Lichenihabitans sp. Uapishka_5]|uniref:hypothetical protein n=1 Tax=Lichenihabitans sp. Uapishka_5 TaxID=3037302 RepID=UPI0029E7E054|nr:hypothetical protein [Lichenihabitans sp. Uapishka_5]MDX7950754.1 hypothetical protein [Lichenihabitans sp. Uapishka_5]